MKISEQIKRLGDGLIERTTVETEIDTQINYIPLHKATKSAINHAFANARLMICALSDKVYREHDITLNGVYKLWETYRSNLYDNKKRLVVEDALCHRQEQRTGIKFLEVYKNGHNPAEEATVRFRIIHAASLLIANEEGLLGLWKDRKARVYAMGQARGENSMQIFPEAMTKDKQLQFDKRLEASFGGKKEWHSGHPLAVLVSLGEEDSAALTYFKANPQALESILIGNCEWMVENVKLRHTAIKSAITNEVLEERYDFAFDN